MHLRELRPGVAFAISRPASLLYTCVMKQGLDDTSSEAKTVQIRLLRDASVARRLDLMRSLTTTVILAARRGIARLHPDWSDDEVGLEFVRIHYGERLFHDVKRKFEQESR